MNLLFPAVCLHCQTPCQKHLCFACAEQLMPLPPRHTRAVLPYYGPAKSLLDAFRTTYSPYLAKGLAGYLALKLPCTPDYLVPTPSPLHRRLKRGYDHALLLTRALSKLIDVPVVQALGRRIGDLPQTALDLETRRQLTNTTFYLKRGAPLHKKTVLLIDDLIYTGRTRKWCRYRLEEAGPSHIFFLALCDDNFD